MNYSFNLHIEWTELQVPETQSVHQSCGVPADYQAANSGFGTKKKRKKEVYCVDK